MHVRRLQIERYRGVEFLELHPSPRTVLVGPNNAGKSTVLEPLRQGQAARMLGELADAGGQIFVTTHSPDIVRAVTLGDIVLISPGPRPDVRPLATSLSAPARYGVGPISAPA